MRTHGHRGGRLGAVLAIGLGVELAQAQDLGDFGMAGVCVYLQVAASDELLQRLKHLDIAKR